jgi:hypothetical protein
LHILKNMLILNRIICNNWCNIFCWEIIHMIIFSITRLCGLINSWIKIMRIFMILKSRLIIKILLRTLMTIDWLVLINFLICIWTKHLRVIFNLVLIIIFDIINQPWIVLSIILCFNFFILLSSKLISISSSWRATKTKLWY